MAVALKRGLELHRRFLGMYSCSSKPRECLEEASYCFNKGPDFRLPASIEESSLKPHPRSESTISKLKGQKSFMYRFGR